MENLCIITYAAAQNIDSDLRIFHFIVAAITPTGSLIRALFVGLNVFSTSCRGEEYSPFPDGLLWYGGPILYLTIQCVALLALLLMLESGNGFLLFSGFKGRVSRADTENDVGSDDSHALLCGIEKSKRPNDIQMLDIKYIATEKSSKNYGLRVSYITKELAPTAVVEDLSCKISRGETFALLGPNGAGKSNKISLIRGDLPLSSGEILVQGISISQNRWISRSHLGVCPQFDAIDLITVLEHLQFYAGIRGVPDIQHNVKEVIKAVGRQGFTGPMVSKLSGGNVYRVSTAFMLI
jgi:ABC-type multidrug transport system fused ATPase/permease subunit